jgi:uncharacterized membrane protein
LTYACIVLLASVLTGKGVILAAPAVFFIPGYVLTAAIFPRRGELTWAERVALSLALSISAVPILGLLLNATAFGVTTVSSANSLISFSILMGVVAYWRRTRIPFADRLSASITFSLEDLRESSHFELLITIALSVSILIVVLFATYVVLLPPPNQPFTSLYIEGPGSGVSYVNPICLNSSQSATITIGVRNREQTQMNYTLLVELVGIGLNPNSTGGNEPVTEINRSLLSRLDISLQHGQDWTKGYDFTIPNAGFWKIQVLLFSYPRSTSTYREVHFFARVPCG